MPKVWTLEQRGISRPGPASSRVRPARPSRRARKPAATGTSWPRTVAAGERSSLEAIGLPWTWVSKLPGAIRLSPLGSADRRSTLSAMAPDGRVAIFGPHPMLSITVEALTADGGDDIHVHAAGQGVWVARMAAELGAEPVLCGFIGGETGTVLRPLLEQLPVELRLVETAEATGAYIHDRRSGERVPVAQSAAMPPSRHEIDDLFSVTCAAALDSDVLAALRPLPGEALPLEIYGDLVADVRANGTPVVVDLSSPRLDSALEGEPDLVKINDWELAAFVSGPVDTEARMRAGAGAAAGGGRRRGDRHPRRGAGAGAARRRGLGAGAAPLRARLARGLRRLDDGRAGGLRSPTGREWEEALRIGAAAGAANFLRHGLGTGARVGGRGPGPPGRAAPALTRRRREGNLERLRPRRSPAAPSRASTRGGAQAARPPRSRSKRRGAGGRPAAVRGVGVAAEHVDEARLGEREHPGAPSPRGGRSRRSPGPAPPRATSPASRSNMSAERWRSGWAISARWPRSARCSTRRSEAVGERPGRRLQQHPAAAAERHPGQLLLARAPSTAVSATSPPWRTTTGIPSSRSRAFSASTRPAISSMRTSWSWRMWGVAQIASIPSAAAWRAIATLSREVERPVVDAGEDVAVEVDHGRPGELTGSTLGPECKPRSGTATHGHGATMIGMIQHLLPLGLRRADGLQLMDKKTTRRGNYESGSDYVLEYGELRFAFNEEDFGQRVEQAAVKLGFVHQGLSQEELDDLLDLAVSGEIAEPSLAPRRAHQRELGGPGRPRQPQPRPLAPPPRLPRRLARPAGQGGRAGRRLRRAHPDLRLRPAGPQLRADRALQGAVLAPHRLPPLARLSGRSGLLALVVRRHAARLSPRPASSSSTASIARWPSSRR